MKVFLTGATGFVGSHLLARLVRDGHDVHVLARDPARAQGLKRVDPDRIEVMPGDVVSGEGLDRAMEGGDAVIHLVGIILETRRATWEKVHHQGTRNAIEAAKRQGIKRFVQMSALGARPNGVSRYQTTKWQAEEAVRAGGIPYVILRPSIIFGPRDGFVSQMVDLMKTAPLVRPVPGHGRYPFRPIYIDNVVDCFAQSLTSSKALNRTIELCGPAELPLAQMLSQIAHCVGVRKPAVKVPYFIMYCNAAVLQAILPRPPVTTDQLRMLREGSTADPRPMLDTFSLGLVGFREGLNKYLCGNRRK